MLNLLLAVITGGSVSIVLRLSKGHAKNDMALFAVNYLVCFLFARAFMGPGTPVFIKAEGVMFTIVAGIIAGALFLLNFILLQNSMKHNGIVLSSTFMKLGVLVPTLMAITVFGETPSMIQLLGFAIAVVAIVMIHFEKNSVENSDHKILLIVLLLAAGVTDSMANIYDKIGNPDLKDHYLFYTFVAAFILAAILSFVYKEKICLQDVIWGILVAIPNYLSARFLLLSLGSVPAVITYPVYSVGSIVLITLAGVFLFKEKLSKQKAFALLLVIVALVLLNI